jgi:hypothetical protein
MTIEERVRQDLAMTRGRMPITIVVDDAAEAARAQAARAGHRWARLLGILTRAEFAARLGRPSPSTEGG